MIVFGVIFMFFNIEFVLVNEVCIEIEVNEVIGILYCLGGISILGFDCFGFILYIMNKYNIDLLCIL